MPDWRNVLVAALRGCNEVVASNMVEIGAQVINAIREDPEARGCTTNGLLYDAGISYEVRAPMFARAEELRREALEPVAIS